MLVHELERNVRAKSLSSLKSNLIIFPTEPHQIATVFHRFSDSWMEVDVLTIKDDRQRSLRPYG